MERKSPESIVLRFVWLENLTQDYTNDEIGQLIRDLYSYAKDGYVPAEYKDRGMRGLWRSMKDGVDKDFSKYCEKSKKATAAIKARWEKAGKSSSQDEIQTVENEPSEIQTYSSEYERIRPYPTYTSTSTNTGTATPDEPPTAAPALQADAELAGIVQHYQAEIGEFPRSALEKLQSWREIFTTELICKAFDEAAENGVRNWKYIDGILKSWQKDGVKTLGDVERRREARKKPDKPKEKEWEVLR